MPSHRPSDPSASRPVEPAGTDEVAFGQGAWAELAVSADIEAVEAVSEILGRVATGGTSVEPGFSLTNEGLSATIDPTRPCVVRAYLPARDRGDVDRAVEIAETALGHLQAFGLRPIGELQLRFVREEDWAEAWKSHFPVLRVGRRLVIRPTWRRHHAEPDDVVLALDPGMAFGTGLHPTTRLCLIALEELADATGVSGKRVLDVGSGSGILSVAAVKLGAAGVRAVDTDPIAVESTLANARRNGVARRISVRQGSVPTGESRCGLVLANLIASLLVALAPALRAELEPGGTIIASGIFRDRESDVRTAFEEARLTPTRRWAEDDWVAIGATAAGD